MWRANLKRLLVVVGIGWVLALGAFMVLTRSSNDPTGPTQDEMAGAIGAQVMEHLYRGHVPGISAEITIVPKPHRYMSGEWDLTTLASGEPDTFTSHPGPWAHLAQVPLIIYGPQLVSNPTENFDAVDLAQIAPTYARVLGMDDFDADGAPLPGLDLDSGAESPPRAILTVVIDGGGWNLLEEHPQSWPTIKNLSQRGLSYMNATTGSAPSLTGAVHPTLGTGFYPKDHGIPTNPAWDVNDLRRPTVSELWDEANANTPVVATTAFHTTHLGMIGRGASREGGDKDIAVLWGLNVSSWVTTRDSYELPEYLDETDLESLASYETELDGRDGSEDGLWFGHGLEELRDPLVRPATPAFARFTADATLDVLQNENIGGDALTDFLWVEMKMPDYAGHKWNMVSPEVGDVLLAVDRQVARLKNAIEEVTGKGNYLLAITADHGQEPLAETTGGWRINAPELERDLTVRFGNVVEAVTTTEVDLDSDQVADGNVDPEEVVSFIGRYTIGHNIPDEASGANLVPDERLDEPLFAGAFTTDYLANLGTGQIESFGDSVFQEGNLLTNRKQP